MSDVNETDSAAANGAARLATGVPGLDVLLGGGLIPGKLTVVIGATGIGKTQLGVKFVESGQTYEGRRGVVFDMTSRGDAQGHLDYAERMANWRMSQAAAGEPLSNEQLFDLAQPVGEYLRVFEQQGRRHSRRDLDHDAWQAWQGELAAKLQVTIAFFYAHFMRGVRRVVVDGLEPVERAGDSIQFELFEYIYHQVLRKDDDWLARDALRQNFRSLEQQVLAHRYDPQRIGCVLLWTSNEVMLEDLINRRLDESDIIAGANTLIYMGKIREGSKFGRALYIAKHRGSRCTDEIVPFTIDDQGLRISG